MAGERGLIDDPTWIDYATMPVPPLQFVLQPSFQPMGIIDRFAPGMTACHTPWFVEVALDVTGVDGVAATVVYLIPKDDDTSLLAACLDQAFDPLFNFMSGADYGDKLTTLVQQHWPDTYAMLYHSQRHTPGERILANVHTVGMVQWVVADEVRGTDRDGIDPRQVEELVLAALQTMIRATNFPVELPGVIDVLGGPDRTSRRLKALSTIFTSGADIGTGLMGGVDAGELLDLAKDVREFVTGLVELRD